MLYFRRERGLLLILIVHRASLSAAFVLVGEWLSLVEHLVRDQGVGGSNPLSPTNLLQAVH
jgi:hypothetical protein